MPFFRVELDTTDLTAQIDQARTRDIPFATAKALTRTAQDGQTEVRREARQKFKLRNQWTQSNIRITPADKLSWPITSEVFTDTANQATGAPDYLVRQEDGGEKIPFGGRQYLALPTKYLRKYAPAIIPEALRPRNLLPPDAQIGKAYKSSFTRSAKRYESISKRGLKALGSSDYVGFLQYDRHGTLCIFIRSQTNRDAEPWYILVHHAAVRAVLGMENTVTRVANDRFETHWDDAWAEIGY